MRRKCLSGCQWCSSLDSGGGGGGEFLGYERFGRDMPVAIGMKARRGEAAVNDWLPSNHEEMWRIPSHTDLSS